MVWFNCSLPSKDANGTSLLDVAAGCCDAANITTSDERQWCATGNASVYNDCLSDRGLYGSACTFRGVVLAAKPSSAPRARVPSLLLVVLGLMAFATGVLADDLPRAALAVRAAPSDGIKCELFTPEGSPPRRTKPSNGTVHSTSNSYCENNSATCVLPSGRGSPSWKVRYALENGTAVRDAALAGYTSPNVDKLLEDAGLDPALYVGGTEEVWMPQDEVTFYFKGGQNGELLAYCLGVELAGEYSGCEGINGTTKGSIYIPLKEGITLSVRNFMGHDRLHATS